VIGRGRVDLLLIGSRELHGLVAGRVRVDPCVIEHHRERLQGLADRPAGIVGHLGSDEADDVGRRDFVDRERTENAVDPGQLETVSGPSGVRDIDPARKPLLPRPCERQRLRPLGRVQVQIRSSSSGDLAQDPESFTSSL
jgi:hypothetical protein